MKPSTKDVDFMIPEIKEHAYLTRQLQILGYEQITGFGWQKKGENFRFDLFRGNNIHTTALLKSPLAKERHSVFMEFSRLYIGILNDYDLITSKLMRGSQVDFEDCLMLTAAHRSSIEIDRLVAHFHETISYDVAEVRLKPNIDRFLELLREKGLYD